MRKLYYIAVMAVGVLMAGALSSCTESTDGPDEPDIEEPSQEELDEAVSRNYHELDWQNTEVMEADTAANTYTIQLTDETKTIRPGNIITLKKGVDYYIVLVDEARVTADAVEITGTQGDLCDIYAYTDVYLSTERNARSGACTPTLVEYVDDDGTVRSLDLSSRATEEKTTLTDKLWHYETKDLKDSEQNFVKDTNIRYGFRASGLDMSIDLVMNMNFGGRSKVQMLNSLRERLRSNMLSVSAQLRGTVESYAKLYAELSGQANYDKGEELIRHNLLRPIYVTFTGPYGVPIQVVLSAELFRTATVEAEGELNFEMGYDTKFSLGVGMEWLQQQGTLKPFSSCEFTSELIPPTLSGKGEVKAKASIYPRIFVMLYNTLGMSFDLAPYASAELSAGFSKALIGNKKDYLAWNAVGRMGLDARNALSVKMMNYEVKHYDVGEHNIIEGLLFETPHDIRLLGYSPVNIEPGKTTSFSFEVTDMNYLIQEESTTGLPAVVNFKADKGRVSKTFDFCTGGQASVDWTPADEDDVLTAFLCDKDGKTLARVSVDADGNEAKGDPENPDEPFDPNDPNSDFYRKLPRPTNELAVDLGLSVLWSGWNLGADSAQYPGGYYAYGETSPRTDFTNDNYEFFKPTHDHIKDGWVYENDYVDIGSITGGKYDAATKQLGSKWHIPTLTECRELATNCACYEYKYRGVDGYLVVSRINNKAIFFPNAGYYWSGWGDDAPHFSPGDAEVWTSTFVRGYWPCAYGMSLNYMFGATTFDHFNRTNGFPIRPVRTR